jgi:two-component system response regulator HydG
MSSPVTILVVDDDESQSTTMAYVLRKKGYDASTASCGAEAIEFCRTNHVDIIFMDIKMPLLNGVETFKEIKRVSPGTVVFMMTAYTAEELIQEAMREGVYDIIYKPLDIEKALVRIREALEAGEPALVMIVDDDESTQQTFKDVLQHRGYKVAIASTGEEAIAKALETDFDIIFLDMKLPTINGLETYEIISKRRPNVVVIIITGFPKEYSSLIEQALMESAYTCLYKPIDMSQALNLVRDIIKEKRGRRNGRQ